MTLKRAYRTLFISFLLMLMTIALYALRVTRLSIQWGMVGFVIAAIFSVLSIVLSIHESQHKREVKRHFIAEHRFEILDWITFLSVSMMAIFTVFMFFVLPSDVKQSSMMPTLSENQRVLILHFLYEPERDDIIILEIERGDNPQIGSSFFERSEKSCDSFQAWITNTCPTVKVLDPYGNPVYVDSIYFVKRLIGLPGDVIEFVNYGDKNPDAIIEDYRYELSVNGEIPLTPRNEPYYVSNAQKDQMEEDLTEGILNEDAYLAMGDNANGYDQYPASFDSRSFGAVSQEDIIGKVIFRLWPFGRVS